jgi:hypothetical protein
MSTTNTPIFKLNEDKQTYTVAYLTDSGSIELVAIDVDFLDFTCGDCLLVPGDGQALGWTITKKSKNHSAWIIDDTIERLARIAKLKKLITN